MAILLISGSREIMLVLRISHGSGTRVVAVGAGPEKPGGTGVDGPPRAPLIPFSGGAGGT